jgi:GPI mannosyltransferase 3
VTPARPLLVGGLAFGLVARLVFGWVDDGLWWPDEYYQSLEPAHRAVFGYGWQAWEFLEGARHWTLPGFVAALMQVSTWLSLPYLRVIEVTFCLAGSATAWAVWKLARAQGASERSAAIAATVFSVMGLAVFIAPRAMGEALSALPITLAFALLFAAPTRGKVVLVGVLLSVAVALRLQNGLFCIGALVVLLRTDRRLMAWLFTVLVVGAVVYGLVDRLTWGTWFHSARVYLQFNLIEGRASSFGTSPFLHYLTAFVTSELTFIPLVLLTALGFKRRPEVPVMALVVLLVHSFIPHKELRFLFPLVPLLVAQAALGLDLVKPWVQVALPVMALVSLALLPTLTFGRLGIVDPPRATSAIDFGGPENRLLVRAGKLDDVCGLRIESIQNWRTGGFAYFHKRVPLYRPGEGDSHFNYAIARTSPGTEVARDGDVGLFKLGAECAADDAYDWHLE